MIPTALAATPPPSTALATGIAPALLSAAALKGPGIWTVGPEPSAGPTDSERILAGLTEGLAPEEAEQCRRLRRPADQWAYAAAHQLLRRLLAIALGVAPAALMLDRDPAGKPFLVWPAGSGLHFNLSHTQDLAAVALCPTGRVGVDVEAEDRPVVLDPALLAFALHAGERDVLAALPAPCRPAAFLRRWTVREAVAKADGRGLSLPFAAIHLTLPDPDRDGDSHSDPEARRAAVSGEAMVTQPQAQAWRIWYRPIAPRHHLALAWQAAPAASVTPRLCRLALRELLPATEGQA